LCGGFSLQFLEQFTQSQMFNLFIQEREDIQSLTDEGQKAKLGAKISQVERFEDAVDAAENAVPTSNPTKEGYRKVARFYKKLPKLRIDS